MRTQCATCREKIVIPDHIYSKQTENILGVFCCSKKCTNLYLQNNNDPNETQCKKCGKLMHAYKRNAKYCSKCRDKIWAKKREKYKTDDAYKAGYLLSNLLYKALERQGNTKSSPTFKMLGYTRDQLIAHKKIFLGKPCVVCKKIIVTNENCHMDHIIPKGIAKTRNEVIQLFKLSNERFICARCNIEKVGQDKKQIKEARIKRASLLK